MYPERRFYFASQMNTTEPAILSKLFYDLYIVLGERKSKNEKFIFRIYYSPLLNFIWIGIGFMALGGIISLFDKKHWIIYRQIKQNKKKNA